MKKDNNEYKLKIILGDVMGSRGLQLIKDVRKDKRDRERIIISGSTLKNNNITFYKNDNQVQDLLEYIDNDEADDEADDDTSSNSWMSY